MKILTLNTWQERGKWRDRWNVIFSGIQKYKPEIIGFQEVFNGDWALAVQKTLGYKEIVFPKEPGGVMFLSQYPVSDWECLTMKTQAPSEDYLRYAVSMEVTAGRVGISFFNTHLSWKTPEGPTREKQVGELAAFIQKKAGGNAIFVMGDFNAPPETPEIRKMAAEGFTDLFAAKNPGVVGLTWDNKNPYAAGSSSKMPDRRIDYIFSKNADLSRLKSVERIFMEPQDGYYASDHYGVLAEFED